MNNARATTEPYATTDNPRERDEHGRFQKGNRGGPGNPFTRQTAQLRRAALQAVSEDDIRDVIETLKTKAREGDVAASKLLLSYAIGKPTAAPDPDTLDQHEWATITGNHAPMPKDLIKIIQGIPVEALLTILGAALPALFPDKLDMAAAAVSRAYRMDIGEDDDDYDDYGDDDDYEDDDNEAAGSKRHEPAASATDGQEAPPPVGDPVPACVEAPSRRRAGQSEQPAAAQAPIPPIGNGCNGGSRRSFPTPIPLAAASAVGAGGWL